MPLQQLMKHGVGKEKPAGSSTGQADGQALAGRQPGVGIRLDDDEEMNTDLSESEAEEEARKMNGDMTKVKKRVKKSEAKRIREGRRHRQK